MTDEQLGEILENTLIFDGEVPTSIYSKKEILSAMREAVQRGIDEYVVTQKGHVFNIWEIEQRRKLLEACRLDSIGFAEWLVKSTYGFNKERDAWFDWNNKKTTSFTKDELYNEYLKPL